MNLVANSDFNSSTVSAAAGGAGLVSSSTAAGGPARVPDTSESGGSALVFRSPAGHAPCHAAADDPARASNATEASGAALVSRTAAGAGGVSFSPSAAGRGVRFTPHAEPRRRDFEWGDDVPFPSAPDVSNQVQTQTPQAGSKMERGGENFLTTIPAAAAAARDVPAPALPVATAATVTDEDVIRYLKARLGGLHREFHYAHVTIGLAAFADGCGREPEFRIAAGDSLVAGEGAGFDEAYARMMARRGGRGDAEILRQRAVALTAAAEKLEAAEMGAGLGGNDGNGGGK